METKPLQPFGVEAVLERSRLSLDDFLEPQFASGTMEETTKHSFILFRDMGWQASESMPRDETGTIVKQFMARMGAYLDSIVPLFPHWDPAGRIVVWRKPLVVEEEPESWFMPAEVGLEATREGIHYLKEALGFKLEDATGAPLEHFPLIRGPEGITEHYRINKGRQTDHGRDMLMKGAAITGSALNGDYDLKTKQRCVMNLSHLIAACPEYRAPVLEIMHESMDKNRDLIYRHQWSKDDILAFSGTPALMHLKYCGGTGIACIEKQSPLQIFCMQSGVYGQHSAMHLPEAAIPSHSSPRTATSRP